MCACVLLRLLKIYTAINIAQVHILIFHLLRVNVLACLLKQLQLSNSQVTHQHEINLPVTIFQ